MFLLPYRSSAAFLLPSQTLEDVQWTHGCPLLPLLPTSFKRSTLWQAWQDVHADPNLHDGLCPRRQRPNPERRLGIAVLMCSLLGSCAGLAGCLQEILTLPQQSPYRPCGDSAWCSVLAASGTSRALSLFAGFWPGTVHHPTAAILCQVEVLGGVSL